MGERFISQGVGRTHCGGVRHSEDTEEVMSEGLNMQYTVLVLPGDEDGLILGLQAFSLEAKPQLFQLALLRYESRAFRSRGWRTGDGDFGCHKTG